MPARNLEAHVRHQPRVAIVDLHGEIDAFAEFLESRGQEITDANLRELIHLMMSTPQFQLA